MQLLALICRSLEIGRNVIGPSGGTAIAEALKGQTSLTKLGIEYNALSDGGIIALRGLIELHNSTLAHLEASNNQAHMALFLSLNRAVAHNVTAPYKIMYKFEPAIYHIRNRIRHNRPSLQGTPPFQWTITPSLPSGLIFDEETGECCLLDVICQRNCVSQADHVGKTSECCFDVTCKEPHIVP